MRISLAGSGSVATHLGAALVNAGHTIAAVWSRNADHATFLAHHLRSETALRLEDTLRQADLLIISVSDDAIPELTAQVRTTIPVVHTSGSTPLSALAGVGENYGIFYPFQTFSKSREVNFKTVPVILEASNPAVLSLLKSLASDVSRQVLELDSAQRLALHVAAVFAANFVNHLYAIADDLLERQRIDPGLLRPLMTEIAAKAAAFSPRDVQTGPAVRGDRGILDKHAVFLQDRPELAEIYALLSQQIINFKR